MSDAPQTRDTPLEHMSIITCPACQHEQAERMPEYSCAIAYRCPPCGAALQPLPDDCCVFCSYGSVPCQAIQIARQPAQHRAHGDIETGETR